jgi:hypothetical protein
VLARDFLAGFRIKLHHIKRQSGRIRAVPVFTHRKNRKKIYPIDLLKIPLWQSLGVIGKPKSVLRGKGKQQMKDMALWQVWYEAFLREAVACDPALALWCDWYADRVAGKPIDLALAWVLAEIPKEKLAQGPAAVQAYVLSQLHASTAQPLNRVRTIFIGYGAAGKTSLVRVLHDETVLPGIEPMTPGISIREWPDAGDNIKTHFWDFGGQVIAHATHQFFLRAQCVYVLVLEARQSQNPNEDAEYWLQHVRAFGGDAPVLLVGNKHDQMPVDLQMHSLRSKYPNIIGFYPLSCTLTKTDYAPQFASFKQALCQQIRQIASAQKLFTRQEFAVLEQVRARARQDAFLSHDEFNVLCEQYEVRDEGDVLTRTWFLDMLDKLGIVIHFAKLPYLRDYVLNPRWLTYGVYKLIFGNHAELAEDDIIPLFKNEVVADEQGNQLRFDPAQCRLIPDAMQQFKLAFRLPHENNRLIIPSLLPSELPNGLQARQFDGEDSHTSATLAYKIDFAAFVPRHTLPELIVVRNEEIDNRQMCQKAVVLKAKTGEARAMLEVDYPARYLLVLVQGRDAREFLDGLRKDILGILRRLNLDYVERIRLPASALQADTPRLPLFPASLHGMWLDQFDWADFHQLENHRKMGRREFISSRGVYDVSRLIDLYGSPRNEGGDVYHLYGNDAKVQKGSNMGNQTIIGSHIGGHAINADKIENAFNSQTTTPELADTLKKLLAEIQSLNAKIPEAQKAALAEPLDQLHDAGLQLETESKKKKPVYLPTLAGMTEAAQKLGEFGVPIVALVELARSFLS